jgi:ribonuclease D
MEVIVNTPELSAACDRLARHPFVAVDTEFLRETTFWPKLCVLQMATPEEAVVVDTLAPELDLTPFFKLMGDGRVVKVFHAARQDVEIVWNLAKIIPAPLFDTQVAAMVLGHGDSVSYDQLVQRLTGDTIDKSVRYTDWSRRPLSKGQLEYAVSDVVHLVSVYEKLKRDLDRSGRTGWVGEEMKVLTSPATYAQEPENAWERLRTRVRKPRELAVLIELAAWREREAQTRDVPRQRVMKDDSLIEIAMQQPRNAEALAGLRFLPKGFERSKAGDAILDAVAAGIARDPRTLPKVVRARPLSESASATVELLKVLLRMTSERHGVAAKVLATVDDLERIAADDDASVPALQGWRRELFGEQALKLKRGELALAMENGRVVVVAR